MEHLSAVQLLVAGLSLFGIGFLLCYTMLYEDLKDKYNTLQSEKEFLGNQTGTNNTYYIKDVA